MKKVYGGKLSPRAKRRLKSRRKAKEMLDPDVLKKRVEVVEQLITIQHQRLNIVRTRHRELFNALLLFRYGGRVWLVVLFVTALLVTIYVPNTIITAHALTKFYSQFALTFIVSCILYIIFNEGTKNECKKLVKEVESRRQTESVFLEELETLELNLRQITSGSST